MLIWLGRTTVLKISLISTLVMFTVVMFIANPMIDGKGGLGVVNIQLTFDKTIAQTIVESWGADGIANFNRLIFTDYLYALSYSFFFASLLAWLILKTKRHNDKRYVWSIYLAFIAGACDWIENTMELFFINNIQTFPNALYILHSTIALIKWLTLPIALGYIVVLLFKSARLK